MKHGGATCRDLQIRVLPSMKASASVHDVKTVKRVGAALGWAAALVGVNLSFLPNIAQPTILIVVVTALTLFIIGIADRRYRARFTGFDAAFILFLTGYFIAEQINTNEISGRSTAIGAVIGLAVPYLATRAARSVTSTWSSWITFSRGLVKPGVLVAIIAVLQVLGFPGLNDLLLNTAPNEGLRQRLAVGDSIRATSTIGHWSSLGGYLCVVSAALCCVLIYTKRRGGLTKRDSWFLIVLSLGQMTTVTFATIALQAVIVGATLVALRVKPAVIVSLGVAVMAAWFLFGAMLSDRVEYQSSGSGYLGTQYNWVPETIAYRIYLWGQQTIPAIELRPWTGWGADIYTESAAVRPPTLVWLSPESEWMRTAVSVGVVVLILQIVVIFTAWRESLRRRAGDPWVTPLRLMFLGVIVVSFIHSHLSNPGVPLILWVVVMSLPVRNDKYLLVAKETPNDHKPTNSISSGAL